MTQAKVGMHRGIVNAALFLFAFLAAAPAATAAETPAESEAAGRLRLLALGDSLTAGWRLPAGESFAARLEAALRQRGHAVTVINAGVSGDTTAGGLARLDWALAGEPDAALVALGANDMLRGLPPEEVERNLDAIAGRLNEAGVPVLLCGMKAAPNLGRAYGEAYEAAFRSVAERHDVLFHPFFLENVAARPDLLLDDGMHPNPEGVGMMVETLMPAVEKLLDRVGGTGTED